jgi:uracil-DNA glycosylase
MTISLPASWQAALAPEINKPYFRDLLNFVDQQYSEGECFPAKKDIFKAFELTDLDQVRVVILGQDPYHTPSAAMGLSFSIPQGLPVQPSLRNIFKELESDLWVHRTNSNLTDWASQGVLLLNSTLTVRSGEAASHAGHGWEVFTDEVIRLLSSRDNPIVFVLWGAYALKKRSYIDETKNKVIHSSHPSPFSVYRGFSGSKPFSAVNDLLLRYDLPIINWE